MVPLSTGRNVKMALVSSRRRQLDAACAAFTPRRAVNLTPPSIGRRVKWTPRGGKLDVNYNTNIRRARFPRAAAAACTRRGVFICRLRGRVDSRGAGGSAKALDVQLDANLG